MGLVPELGNLLMTAFRQPDCTGVDQRHHINAWEMYEVSCFYRMFRLRSSIISSVRILLRSLRKFLNFILALKSDLYGRRKHEREWGRPSQGSKQQWKLTHNNCHHQGYNPCGFQTTDFSSDVCFHHLTPLEWAQTTEISMAIVAAGRCRLFERRRVTRTHTQRRERDFKGLSQTMKTRDFVHLQYYSLIRHLLSIFCGPGFI